MAVSGRSCFGCGRPRGGGILIWLSSPPVAASEMVGAGSLNVIVKPAVPARKGINPFTKEPTVFKAKPKRKVIKARVLKSLKEAV